MNYSTQFVKSIFSILFYYSYTNIITNYHYDYRSRICEKRIIIFQGAAREIGVQDPRPQRQKIDKTQPKKKKKHTTKKKEKIKKKKQ